MSEYTKLTDFAVKDGLTAGVNNQAKRIKGTEINIEFQSIATAMVTKADKNNPTLTGTPSAPTALPAVNNTQIATTAYTTAAITAQAIVTGVLGVQIDSAASLATGRTLFIDDDVPDDSTDGADGDVWFEY